MPKNTKKNIVNIKVKKKLLQLYASFYLKFYLLETELRSHLIAAFEKQYGSDWFTKLEPDLELFQHEVEIIKGRKKRDFRISPKLFVHESSFGFWIELFGREPFKILKGLPIKAFGNLPKDIKRKGLYRMLSGIKNLRNKLYHHRIGIESVSETEIATLQEINDNLGVVIKALDMQYAEMLDPKQFDGMIQKLKGNRK